jgi:hypothetical protein
LFSLFAAPACRLDFVRHVGMVWLFIGIGGGLFGMIRLSSTVTSWRGVVRVFKV